MSEWISVEDRLPEAFQEVIICSADMEVMCGYYHNGIELFISNHENIWTEAKFWMPIPEPPEVW